MTLSDTRQWCETAGDHRRIGKLDVLDVFAELDRVRAERDALRAACRQVLEQRNLLDDNGADGWRRIKWQALEGIRDALAKGDE